MEEKYFFLYFNATIATLIVNLLVYSVLRVAITPVFIATYCHLLPRPSKQRAEAEQFCPRPWILIPTYTGFHTHVHGYGCPKSWVTVPKTLGKDAPHSWAKMPKGLGNMKICDTSCRKKNTRKRKVNKIFFVLLHPE